MSSLGSEDFAVLLGLKAAIHPQADLDVPVGQEFRRKELVMHHLLTSNAQPENEQDKIWSQFCADYLPATVDRLLDLPVPTDATNAIERGMLADFPLHNPWHEMLVRIQHIPYFAKYLRSSSPVAAAGKHLPQILADRLANISDKWDKNMTEVPHNKDKRQYYEAAAGSAIQLLSTLCTHFVNEADRTTVISHETQRKLSPILTVWSRRYDRQFLGDVSVRMVAYMSESAQFSKDSNKVRKAHKNWDVCGLPSCNVRKELKVCARCQTVRYCSREHQTKDWSSASGSHHKDVCHQTKY